MRLANVFDRRLTFLKLFSLVLSGCAMSQNPLSSPEKSRPDEGLCGCWKALNEKHQQDCPSLLLIGKSPEPDCPAAMMTITITDFDRDKRLKVDSFSCFPTRLGSHHYLNIVASQQLEKSFVDSAPYIFAKYDFKDEKLRMCLIDLKGTQTAIEQGRLKGRIHSDGLFTSTITLTSSTEELRQFLADRGDSTMFPPENDASFVRVR
jgi:hypothetical protein